MRFFVSTFLITLLSVTSTAEAQGTDCADTEVQQVVVDTVDEHGSSRYPARQKALENLSSEAADAENKIEELNKSREQIGKQFSEERRKCAEYLATHGSSEMVRFEGEAGGCPWEASGWVEAAEYYDEHMKSLQVQASEITKRMEDIEKEFEKKVGDGAVKVLEEFRKQQSQMENIRTREINNDTGSRLCIGSVPVLGVSNQIFYNDVEYFVEIMSEGSYYVTIQKIDMF
jgi:hypothetical protein